MLARQVLNHTAHVTLGSGKNLFQERCSSQRLALKTCSVEPLLSDLHSWCLHRHLQRFQGVLTDTTDSTHKEAIEAPQTSLPGP